MRLLPFLFFQFEQQEVYVIHYEIDYLFIRNRACVPERPTKSEVSLTVEWIKFTVALSALRNKSAHYGVIIY